MEFNLILMVVKISNVMELCEFIETHKPEFHYLNRIMVACIGCLFLDDKLTSKEQSNLLKTFWNQYSQNSELPFFIE